MSSKTHANNDCAFVLNGFQRLRAIHVGLPATIKTLFAEHLKTAQSSGLGKSANFVGNFLEKTSVKKAIGDFVFELAHDHRDDDDFNEELTRALLNRILVFSLNHLTYFNSPTRPELRLSAALILLQESDILSQEFAFTVEKEPEIRPFHDSYKEEMELIEEVFRGLELPLRTSPASGNTKELSDLQSHLNSEVALKVIFMELNNLLESRLLRSNDFSFSPAEDLLLKLGAIKWFFCMNSPFYSKNPFFVSMHSTFLGLLGRIAKYPKTEKTIGSVLECLYPILNHEKRLERIQFLFYYQVADFFPYRIPLEIENHDSLAEDTDLSFLSMNKLLSIVRGPLSQDEAAQIFRHLLVNRYYKAAAAFATRPEILRTINLDEYDLETLRDICRERILFFSKNKNHPKDGTPSDRLIKGYLSVLESHLSGFEEFLRELKRSLGRNAAPTLINEINRRVKP